MEAGKGMRWYVDVVSLAYTEYVLVWAWKLNWWAKKIFVFADICPSVWMSGWHCSKLAYVVWLSLDTRQMSSLLRTEGKSTLSALNYHTWDMCFLNKLVIIAAHHISARSVSFHDFSSCKTIVEGFGMDWLVSKNRRADVMWSSRLSRRWIYQQLVVILVPGVLSYSSTPFRRVDWK